MSVHFLYVDSKDGAFGTLNLVLEGGVPRQVRSDHHNFKLIREALRNGSSSDAIKVLVDGPEPVTAPTVLRATDFVAGKVKVVAGKVYYQGLEVRDCIATAIAKLQQQGLPIDGMVAFLQRLYENVDHRVRNESYSFIERNGIVVTSTGEMVLYKAVRENYLDKHSGTFLNKPGTVVKMDRKLCDPDYTQHCSKGLHAGALEYIKGFGGGNDRIVILLVAPENVVSVPDDCNCQKIRCCEYYVLGDFNGELKKGHYEAEKSSSEWYAEEKGNDDFDWDSISESDDCDDDQDDDDDYYDDGDVVSSDGSDCDDDYYDDEDDEDDEDYPYPDDEDDDECDDDCGCNNDTVVPSAKDVAIKIADVAFGKQLGVKPSGQHYHNLRGPGGKFAKRT